MRYKIGDLVTTSSGITFFFNDLSKDLKIKLDKLPSGFNAREYYLTQIKTNIFFRKNFVEPNDMLAQIRGWFLGMGNESPFVQPTEFAVRKAMILNIDEGTYVLKSGGDSVSDNCYVSHFKWCISDPKTGNDKDVVLIKKYSSRFEDVLITLKDFEELYELTKTARDIVEKDFDDACFLFSLISIPKRRNRPEHKHITDEIIWNHFEKLNPKSIEGAKNILIERLTNSANHIEKYGYMSLIGETQESLNNKRDLDVADYRNRVKLISEYYEKINVYANS